MKLRKKIEVKGRDKNEYKLLTSRFSTENACLDAVFINRALKEAKGCINCGADIFENYKKINGRKGYQCNKCLLQVYPMSQTIFDRTHLDLTIWFEVIIDMIMHKSGFSANIIQFKYGISQGTAWNLVRRIDDMMKAYMETVDLKGSLEIDETAIPTGNKGLSRNAKLKRGFGSHRMTPFLSIVERGGSVRSFKLLDREEYSLVPLISDNVEYGSTIYTDELKSYNKLKELGYKHKTVNHSKNEYKKEDASTNTVEGFFGHVKPNIRGTHRHISDKHSQRYMDRYDFRYSTRHDTLEVRLEKLLDTLPPLFDHIRNSKGLK